MPAPTDITDSFTRGDNATNLGLCDQSIPWIQEVSAGPVFGISTDQAYVSASDGSANSGNGPFALIDHGWSDGTISADLYGDITSPTFDIPGLAWRWTDQSNFYYGTLSSTGSDVNFWVGKCVGGSVTALFGASGFSVTALTGPWHVEITLAGSSLTVLVNSLDTANTSDSFNQTATFHGLSLFDADATERLDNYAAYFVSFAQAVPAQALAAAAVPSPNSAIQAVPATALAAAPGAMVVTPLSILIGTAT